MTKRIDDSTRARIVELHTRYGLKTRVISQRLGIAERTIRIYLRAMRNGTIPYAKVDDPNRDGGVSSITPQS